MRSAGLWAAVALVLAASRPAEASVAQGFEGHLTFGYAQLFATDAPGGSLAVGAGVDHGIAESWRLGADIDYDLLGSRQVNRGSEVANLDYSMLEALLLAHWEPKGLGPIGRVSFGPGFMSARASLSTSGGGLAFEDLPIDEFAPGVALDVTLISTKKSPVRAGVVFGAREAFLTDDTWMVLSARLAIHY